MRFLVDAQLPPALVTCLRSAGLEARHVARLDPSLLTDESIWRLACEEGRTIVSKDADFVERVIVPAGPDVADDWIAERATPDTVVVTADLPLADRCVKKGARVLSPKGQEWSAQNIGAALATRNLMTDLRSAGETTSGPPPFGPRDRSAFLSALDLALTRIARERGRR